MKHTLLILLILTLSVAQAKTLTIAVAANVSYAIDEIVDAFNAQHPQTKVRVILGSSGKLTAQIKNGAPYEVFMAANMKYPQSLHDDKIAITKPIVYAQGALAFLSKTPRDFSVDMATLLGDTSINKIALANPKTAPYGAKAFEAMKNLGILEKFKHKFVYAESISQAVSYAVTAADIGFIAMSSLYSDKMSAYKKGTHWAAVDSTLYAPIDQGIVLLKRGKDNKEARAFYEFVLNKTTKAILKDYGYIVP